MEGMSFAKHFIPELRENGVSEEKITIFADAVEKIMRPYRYSGAPPDGFDAIKSRIKALLRIANG